MRMTVLASGSKGNSTVIAGGRTKVLVDAGLSCRELLRRMALVGEDPASLNAILVTHEHQDHVSGLGVLARRLGVPVFLTESTHRAWVRMLTPRTTMTYAKWLDHLQAEKLARVAAVPTYAYAAADSTYARAGAGSAYGLAGGGGREPEELEAIAHISAEAAALDESLHGGPGGKVRDGLEATLSRADDPEAAMELPAEGEDQCDEEAVAALPAREKADPTFLPAVEYFRSGTNFAVGDLTVSPFTIPHDAADPCGFVFEAEGIRMAIATDLGYMPPNVKAALRRIDVLLLESNHDVEMLRDGPYPWSVKQRVLSRLGHLSNDATAEFLAKDYDGGAAYIVLGHLSESNNNPALALLSAEQAIGDRMTLLGNRILLAPQAEPMESISL